MASRTPRFTPRFTPRLGGMFSTLGGAALMGPVGSQTIVTNLFLLLAVDLMQFGWAEKVRPANSIPLIALMTYSVELPRLLFEKERGLIVSLYATLPLFGILCVVSREAHNIVAVTYFSLTLACFVQCGLPTFQKHAMIYIGLFLCVYSAVVIIMQRFFVSMDNLSSIGAALTPPINPGKETTVLISLAIIGTGFVFLERFIRVYSHTLLRNRNILAALEMQNRELNQEMKEINREKSRMLDTDSPLMVAIKAMKRLIAKDSTDPEVKLKLRQLLAILSQSRLYAPDLKDKVDDHDVGKFLTSLVGDSVAEPLAVYHHSKTTAAKEGGKLPSSRHRGMHAMPALSHEQEKLVAQMLENLESWNDFDVFELDRVSGGHALFFVGTALFQRYGLTRKTGASEQTVQRLFRLIEDGYSQVPNAYHNAVHAADTLQAMHFFIACCGLAQYMTDMDILAAILACAFHDVGHPGRTNAFLKATMHELAVLYNDQSVLENFHCSTAFELLSNAADANVLAGLNDTQYREVRENVVTMILATDLVQHFDLLSKFTAKHSTNGFVHPDRSARLLVFAIAMKAADISNQCRRANLSKAWTARLMEEFYVQGDDERSRGMPISAYSDRERPAVAKCETGFIEYVVMPLFEAWTEFLPEKASIVPLLSNLRANLASWRADAQ